MPGGFACACAAWAGPVLLCVGCAGGWAWRGKVRRAKGRNKRSTSMLHGVQADEGEGCSHEPSQAQQNRKARANVMGLMEDTDQSQRRERVLGHSGTATETTWAVAAEPQSVATNSEQCRDQQHSSNSDGGGTRWGHVAQRMPIAQRANMGSKHMGDAIQLAAPQDNGTAQPQRRSTARPHDNTA
ncbi:uncharacterized protein BJ171DRAFT_474817 [Polychytrium aggregatum]|uniref:uncharacterized protein n=1 Tax=Polychytrium aggregatum TaxID=110093 RepID=UPI0022FF2871|nr:uncharacterized protein BJ171DRAFT_474817 [Polychytrium aggregatum]KAI9204578.1 hypothetical protein BJ171DRAFT_474817 [Polychytrium aggregatum]